MEKKFYLTEQGVEKIKKQCRELLKIRKSKLKGGAPQSFHSEEISSEYLAFQEDLNFLEDKIKELKYVLKNIKLIKPPSKAEQNVVNLGAEVLLRTKDNKNNLFRIVGSLEANPSLGMISDESPLGKILLGHKIGDEVVVQTAIKTAYKIKKIRYNF